MRYIGVSVECDISNQFCRLALKLKSPYVMRADLVSRCDPHGRFTIQGTIQGEPRTRARRVIQRVTRRIRVASSTLSIFMSVTSENTVRIDYLKIGTNDWYTGISGHVSFLCDYTPYYWNLFRLNHFFSFQTIQSQVTRTVKLLTRTDKF